MDAVGAVGAAGCFPDLVNVGDQAQVDQVPIAGLLSRSLPLVVSRAMGIDEPVVDLVRDVAQAYQPGTATKPALTRRSTGWSRCSAAATTSRPRPVSGSSCRRARPPAVLIERARRCSVDYVLRDHPPVSATKRQALVRTTVGDVTIEAGEVVQVRLAGDLAFGAGPRRCPGREHALALVEESPRVKDFDIETGSAGAAVAVAAAGAVGVNIEDAMGSAAAHAALIRSVKREVPHLFVNARTDTHWQRRGDLTETLRRIRHYADAGADAVFVPRPGGARRHCRDHGGG